MQEPYKTGIWDQHAAKQHEITPHRLDSRVRWSLALAGGMVDDDNNRYYYYMLDPLAWLFFNPPASDE